MSITTQEDAARSVTLAGTDPDGDALTFQVTSGPSRGTLTGTPPNLTYSPTSNYNGADSFTYVAKDASATSAPVTVSITVTAVNDTPVASDVICGTGKSRSGLLQKTSGGFNAVDPDANPKKPPTLAYSLASSPNFGTVTVSGSTWTYTPTSNATSDSFTYPAFDGQLFSNAGHGAPERGLTGLPEEVLLAPRDVAIPIARLCAPAEEVPRADDEHDALRIPRPPTSLGPIRLAAGKPRGGGRVTT